MLHGRMLMLALASVWLTLAAPTLALAQAPGARPAQTPPPGTQPAQVRPAPSQPAPSQPADPGRTEYLAERLRQDPVFVSDHVPRAIPPADAERIREIVAGTGVPTYLVALPGGAGEPSGELLLAALHDQLGADGLYVFLGVSGTASPTSLAALAYGHDLPTAAAVEAVTRAPADAGPPGLLERFVQVLTSGEAEAIAQESSARGQGGEPLLEPEERAFLVGTAASGVPVAALAVTWFVRRARRRRREPGGAVTA